MLKFIMAAVSKAKPLPLGSGARLNKGPRSQLRTFQSQSSPVYKTQSDPTNGMRGVNRNNRVRERRGIFTVGGNNDKKVKSLEDVATAIKTESFQNIVVVAGAGISTPSGIPDFRTPGTGLYDNLQQYRIPYPEAIFDIDFFHHNPKPFFTLAKELYPTGKYRPNFIHYFVRLLHDKGMLLRMYTQNIDGLERIAGLPADKMVEAHGTFSDATCLICRHKHDKEDIKGAVFSDKIPKCKKPGCMGVVKPDITFFGEDLPKRFYFYMRDMLQADLVIVMGTSLEVQPFAGIIDSVKWGVPRVLFNMHAVGPFKYQRRAQDFISPGDLINSVQKFSDLVGWKEDMVQLITKEEGKFVLCSQDYAKKMKEMQSKPPPPPPRDPPVRFWRQPAKLNLFDSESESSSEMSETESESSESEDEKPKNVNRNNKYRKGLGVSVSAPRGGSKNDLDMKRNGKPGPTGRRNFSTDSQLTTRSERLVRNNRNHATATKIADDVNQATSRLEKIGIRPKSNTSDSSKRKPSNEKPIRRTVSDRNLKSKVSGTGRPPLQRSNSAKSVNEKDLNCKKEQKVTENGKSSSDSKCDINVKTADSKVLKETNGQLSKENRTVLDGVKNGSQSSQKKENSEDTMNNGKSSSSRPPLPQNQRNKKPPLNPVNPRPYGFVSQRKLPQRPSMQANLVREKFFTEEDSRPASADLPRIAYRHRLKPSYDARIFAVRVVDSSSESSEESSSEESR